MRKRAAGNNWQYIIPIVFPLTMPFKGSDHYPFDEKGRLIRERDGIPLAITSDERLVLIQHDDALRLWDIETSEEAQRFDQSSVAACAFSPDEDLLAVLDDKGRIRIWSRPSGN